MTTRPGGVGRGLTCISLFSPQAKAAWTQALSPEGRSEFRASCAWLGRVCRLPVPPATLQAGTRAWSTDAVSSRQVPAEPWALRAPPWGSPGWGGFQGLVRRGPHWGGGGGTLTQGSVTWQWGSSHRDCRISCLEPEVTGRSHKLSRNACGVHAPSPSPSFPTSQHPRRPLAATCYTPPHNHESSLSLNLPALDTFYKEDRITRGLPCLAAVRQRGFPGPSCRGACWRLTRFYGCVLSHGTMDPHFLSVYSLMDIWAVSTVWLLCSHEHSCPGIWVPVFRPSAAHPRVESPGHAEPLCVGCRGPARPCPRRRHLRAPEAVRGPRSAKAPPALVSIWLSRFVAIPWVRGGIFRGSDSISPEASGASLPGLVDQITPSQMRGTARRERHGVPSRPTADGRGHGGQNDGCPQVRGWDNTSRTGGPSGMGDPQ